ncbi:MAG: hypothetical protein JO316_09805 [Abitibacteriaceae bacterium]|nr:hypothetical protein [Abditibacteriaceae bacterium]
MISKFRQQKSQFEQIRLMLQQDKNVVTVGNDWVETRWLGYGELTRNTVSAERLALYRARLRQLGFSRVDRVGIEQVQLELFGGGFADTTWGIGYVWSDAPPQPLVTSAYNSMPMREHRNYSPLEGHWYIYHRR